MIPDGDAIKRKLATLPFIPATMPNLNLNIRAKRHAQLEGHSIVLLPCSSKVTRSRKWRNQFQLKETKETQQPNAMSDSVLDFFVIRNITGTTVKI